MATDTRALAFTHTSVGKKVLMAATGAFLFLFVIGHLLGNLQIYAGREAINNYAQFLHSVPLLVWGARIVLLLSLLVHATVALQTSLQSLRSRSSRYRWPRRYVSASFASRTMRWTGPLILLYLLYHLAHLTLGVVHRGLFIYQDVHGNIVSGFSDPVIASAYIAAMLVLGLHLVHGVWSVFQTIGLNNSRWTDRLRAGAAALTSLIVVGNISIPIAVLVGIIR